MPNVYRKYDTKTGVWADFGDLKARNDIGIVEDTDTATHTISAGQYIIWKGNLYTANSAITVGDDLSTSNLTAVSNGGLNKLNSSISAINSSLAIIADGDTHPLINSGEYVYVKNHSTLTEGLYTANSTIVETDALTTSNLTSVGSKGTFNKTISIAHGGTGASNVANARRNLGFVGAFFSEAVFAEECIEIPRNANLNTTTYCATGKYYVPTNAQTATITNCPTGGMAFQMLVLNLLDGETGPMVNSVWTSRTRIIMTYEGNIYVQLVDKNRTTITYGAWRKITMA